MPIRVLSDIDKKGYQDKLLMALEPLLDNKPPVDIITFIEGPEYLAASLYPMQRLILKLYYKLPLTLEELTKVRYLIEGNNKYARAFIPGIKAEWAYLLSDEELQAKLLEHYATTLLLIGGRRSGKSVLGSFIGAYCLYLLLKDKRFEQITRYSEAGIANVATGEEQAKILFNSLSDLVRDSPWFKRVQYKLYETKIEFPGKNLYAKSLHSNSSAVRGGTNMADFYDEFAHFNKQGGRLSDKAMYAALSPSTLTFKRFARHVIITSPLNKAGVTWELFDLAEKGKSQDILAFQLATWEFNPTVPQTDEQIANMYALDTAIAEMEFGAQFAEQFGQFLPPEAVDKCTLPGEPIQMIGEGHKYIAHLDLAKNNDEAVLVIGYYDKQARKVRIVHGKVFSKDEYYNEHNELDIAAVESYILEELKANGWHFAAITFDQFNSLATIQRLRERGLPAEEFTFTEKANQEIFSNLRTLITGSGISWYDDFELVRQLKQLTRSVKRNGKFKVEAPLGDKDDYADCVAVVAYNSIKLASIQQAGIVQAALKGADKVIRLPDDNPELQHHPQCDEEACYFTCEVLADAIAKQRAGA